MFKTFPKGGIHPPENKLTADKSIVVLPLPAQVTVPVSQHIGAPATTVVEKGAAVKTGQVIAQAKGFVSANIHSPVSGKVNKIEPVTDTTGYKQMSVVIDVEGDEWVETIDRSSTLVKEITMTREQIIERCQQCGLVGLGGAAFPTHIKLTVPAGKKCDMIIINGVECEPYLTSDHRLMLEKGAEVLTGATIIMKALGVEKAIIGIEANKPDAINHLTALSKDFEGVTVQPLKVKYPQGGEKQLIKSCTGREVPSGGLPLDVGVVVQNVGTAFAVYEAVQKNKPLIERVVTVTGKSVSNPGNFLVRIGTPVSSLIEAAGGMPEDTGKVVNGGPMMGKALAMTDVPVTKGTSGIILFPADEARRSEVLPCIRCGKCSTVCAMGLEPYLLAAASEKAMWEKAEKEKITDCMECGACAYTCPAKRPLVDYIRLGKTTVMRMARERITK
ncbi:MAG TPA: electron transport complex subunit RsxC [Bacteroidales bacterium]|nr:electron transport complex subunit RsxC [Bacteroidales bacterium]